ncbi:MAG: cytochrome c biogenesis protein ResB [Desulfuromonadales bacterium]
MSKQVSFTDRLWDFFCSLKLAIVTLILLALTSIIGTIIEQNLPAEEYLQKYGMSESTYRLLDSLQFFDMYHSYWFLSLMGIFAVNLICCSIKRLPRIIKTVREPVLKADDGLFRTFSNRDEIVVKEGTVEAVRDQLVGVLGKKFAKPVVNEEDGKAYLFAQKAAYSRFGVYLTHTSILIIFLGAMIGNVWGYKAYVNIVEGRSVDAVWPRGGEQPIPLGFEVRCDDFEVTFYEGGGRPKDYTSDLVILENGQEVLKKTIEVNDPLSYKGLTFYQSSYGPAGDPSYKFRVTQRETGETVEVNGRQNQHLPLPGGGSLIPMGYAPSYQNFGPAAQVSIDAGDHQHGRPFIVFQNFPQFDEKRGGAYAVTLLGVNQTYFTGLQVAKDPGVWVVWLGCLLMVLGSCGAFFLSHRRLWVTIQPLDKGVGVKFGGSAHRNQPAFALFFDELKQDFNDALSSLGRK